MTIKDGKLRCDMSKDCSCAVTHIDEKGFVYCRAHGAERKGWKRCRALRPYELRRLGTGKTIHYERKAAGFYEAEDRRSLRSLHDSWLEREIGRRFSDGETLPAGQLRVRVFGLCSDLLDRFCLLDRFGAGGAGVSGVVREDD